MKKKRSNTSVVNNTTSDVDQEHFFLPSGTEPVNMSYSTWDNFDSSPIYTSTLTTTSTDAVEWSSKHEPKEEISVEFEEDHYEIIDINSFLNETGGMNDSRWDRVKDLMIICTSCMERYFFKTILRRSQYTCPNCDNKLFGIEKDQRYRLVKEILIGEGKYDEEVKE